MDVERHESPLSGRLGRESIDDTASSAIAGAAETAAARLRPQGPQAGFLLAAPGTPSMYGDTAVIRRRAAELRERAAEIRAEADRLVARTDAVGWLGLAGDALRDRVRERALALRRSAGLHDDAADALDRHAHEVERLQRLIEEVERRVRRLVEPRRPADAWLDASTHPGVAAGPGWTWRSPACDHRRTSPRAPRTSPASRGAVACRPPRSLGLVAADPLLEPLRPPEIAYDVEVTAPRLDGEPGRARLRCRHGLRGDRVASTAWAGGEVEVAAYGIEHWQTELARAATVPRRGRRRRAPAARGRRRAARRAPRRRRGPPHPTPTCSTSSSAAPAPHDPAPPARPLARLHTAAAAGCSRRGPATAREARVGWVSWLLCRRLAVAHPGPPARSADRPPHADDRGSTWAPTWPRSWRSWQDGDERPPADHRRDRRVARPDGRLRARAPPGRRLRSRRRPDARVGGRRRGRPARRRPARVGAARPR